MTDAASFPFTRAESGGLYRVLCASESSKNVLVRTEVGDGSDVVEAAVPLWRGKQQLCDTLKRLIREERSGGMIGCEMLRVEARVAGVGVDEAIHWLRSQQGAGGAHVVKGVGELKLALLPEGAPPTFRYYGGSRFDPGAVVGEEWADYRGHIFILPRVELVSSAGGSGNGIGETSRKGREIGDAKLRQGFVLAVNARIDDANSGCWGSELLEALVAVEGIEVPWGSSSLQNNLLSCSLPPASSLTEGTSYDCWAKSVENALSQMREGRLQKVVLARNCLVKFSVDVEPLDLLMQLRSQNGYLFFLQPSRASAFLGCSPEPLFRISPSCIETMAIAGTRRRGGTREEDEILEKELMSSQKDMLENAVTAHYIEQQLAGFARDVVVSDVFIMKLRHVQHIARRIQAKPCYASEGREGVSTPIGLLLGLNPTPAVCGEPRPVATKFIRTQEAFDRGLYGGPVGFVSSTVCEFCVAIRSVLCQPRMLHVFAGAGIVPGSSAKDEWDESAMKMRNVLQLVSSSPCRPLAEMPNINTLWATLLIEELIRCGVDHFCVCPGSRSTPLAFAIGRNHRSSSRVFHDERSAGFYCVGYARGSGKAAACIVTSGTAVANLFPSVVEASQAGIPMLLLTADRPPELRDCGANQTIDQPALFGRYTRWTKDVPCPTDEIPVGAMLSDADYAVHCAHFGQRGPVHLNLMYRENLAPDAGTPRGANVPGGSGRTGIWGKGCLASWRIAAWERGVAPYTSYTQVKHSVSLSTEIVHLLLSARRGIIIAGNLPSECDRLASAWLAAELGWPLLSDVQSGLRLDHCGFGFSGVPYMDQMLVEPLLASNLGPDVILQLGDHVVSARIASLISSCAHFGATSIIIVSGAPGRQDPNLAANFYIAAPPSAFAFSLGEYINNNRGHFGFRGTRGSVLARGLSEASLAVQKIHQQCILMSQEFNEPYVACRTTTGLRNGSALFLSASMPVRDVDMFFNPSALYPIMNIASNRGASGIDGIVSSAIGYSTGLARPVTLLIGDVATMHDLSALHCLQEATHPMCIVIVNNGGCGIFSFLPVASHQDVFPRLFDLSHSVEFGGVSYMFGVEYRRADSCCEFDQHLREAQESPKHFVIEAITHGDNVRVHRELGQLSASSVKSSITKSISISWTWGCNTHRPVCLMLHGFLGCKEDWGRSGSGVFGAVEAAGFSVIIIDLPGHGSSLPSGRGAWIPSVVLSADYAVEAIEGLLEHLGVLKNGMGRFALVGYSMGGRLAMRLVERLRGNVACCAVVSAHPGLQEGKGCLERMLADENTASRLREAQGGDKFERWLHAWYALPLFGRISQAEGYRDMLMRRCKGNPGLLSDVMVGHTIARQPSLWSTIEFGHTPVLYIAGAQDSKYSAIAHRLNRAENGLLVKIIPNASHAVLEESPDQLGNLVSSFFAIHVESTAQATNASLSGHMIASVTVKNFTIPLKSPLELSRGPALTHRSGLIVEVSTMGGNFGHGECTPLPGFQAETVTQCAVQLNLAAKLLRGRIMPRKLARLDGSFEVWLFSKASSMESFAQWFVAEIGGNCCLKEGDLSPCAFAAVEGAVLQALAHAEGVPLCVLLAHECGWGLQSHIKINGVATRNESVSQAITDWGDKFDVVKVKVGGSSPEEDAEVVNRLVRIMQPTEGRLRLDANQAWTLEKAVRFAGLLEKNTVERIEYIEEPLSDPSQLPLFFDQTGIKYALDESIEQGLLHSCVSHQNSQGLAALVVKPSVLGGIERCKALVALAGNVQVVVSSTFETSVGLAHLALCAGALNNGGGGGVAHGLGTYAKLGKDLLHGGIGECVQSGGNLDLLAVDKKLKDARSGLISGLKAWDGTFKESYT